MKFFNRKRGYLLGVTVFSFGLMLGSARNSCADVISATENLRHSIVLTGACTIQVQQPAGPLYEGPAGGIPPIASAGSVVVNCQSGLTAQICFGAYNTMNPASGISGRALVDASGNELNYVLLASFGGSTTIPGDRGCAAVDASYGVESYTDQPPFGYTGTGSDQTINLLATIGGTTGLPAGTYSTEVPIKIVL